MNIHIVPDEKFIDTFIEIAEDVCSPGANIFLVRDSRPFKYLKSDNVIEAPLDSLAFKTEISKAGQGDFIYIHYLSPPMCAWINETDCKATFIWVFWGAEFYETAGVKFDLYDPLTARYVRKMQGDEPLSRYWILDKYRKWKNARISDAAWAERHETVGKAIAKLGYIMHYNPLDYELIKHHFPTQARFLYFNYPAPFDFEQMEKSSEAVENPFTVSGHELNVWLGNSGYPANNHLDFIERLQKSGIDRLKVWVPLNYGDPDYIEHIKEQGHGILGNRFEPVLNYLSFDQFVKVLHAMDIGIMSQKRPQAFGNIQLLLYFGKKVFMYDNTLYRFLLQKGYHIFPAEKAGHYELEMPLSREQQEHNRQLMNSQFSKAGAKTHFANCLHLK